MPHGPQGQKRSADTVAHAAVERIVTGEIVEEVEYATAEARRGSADGRARAQRVSSGELNGIVEASAEAKWNEERRVGMTNKERLMAALFDNPQREHVDIKFFLGGGMDVGEEALCGEAVKMLEQMDEGEGDRAFVEDFQQRDVADFLAAV